MPKAKPIAINFQPGDPVRQKNGVIEGITREFTVVESIPHYRVNYVDPETGDNDERAFVDGQIVDHEGGDEAAERIEGELLKAAAAMEQRAADAAAEQADQPKGEEQ